MAIHSFAFPIVNWNSSKMINETTNITNKVLVIGLDGMSPYLLERLVAEGHMPNVGKLMNAGVYGHLKSTIPPITSVAWASFLTGKNPGKHGIYGFLRFNPDNPMAGVSLVNSQAIVGEALPDIVSRCGKRVGLINLAMTYPPKPVNGFMVTGFLTPSTDSEFTYPPELKMELLEKFPNYDFSIHRNLFDTETNKGFDKFIQTATDIIRTRAEATLWLMDKHDWDLLITHFQTIDGVQHALWHYIDPDIEMETKKERLKRSRTIEFYTTLDKVIGRIIDKLDTINNNATKIIMSDHGFGPDKGMIYPNNLLVDWGLLKPARKPVKQLIKEFIKSLPYIASFYRATIKNAIKKIKGVPFKLKLELEHKSFDIARKFVLSQTKAYFLSTGTIYGYLYRNNSESTLSQSENLLDPIIDKLHSIKHPQNNQPIFGNVYSRDEIYSGPFLHIAPDLVVAPADEGYQISDELNSGSLVTTYQKPRLGTHRRYGIFIAKGNVIKQIKSIQGLNIIDLAPTILYLMGCPVSREIDGKVVTDIFEESYLTEHQIQYTEKPPKDAMKSNGNTYSDDERAKVEERLKALGYL